MVSSYNLASESFINPPRDGDQKLALEYFGVGYFGTKEYDTTVACVCQFDLQTPGVYDALATTAFHTVAMAEVIGLILR
jgi:hypothetical protein